MRLIKIIVEQLTKLTLTYVVINSAILINFEDFNQLVDPSLNDVISCFFNNVSELVCTIRS